MRWHGIRMCQVGLLGWAALWLVMGSWGLGWVGGTGRLGLGSGAQHMFSSCARTTPSFHSGFLL
jgi:hypothetical protein